MNTAKTSAPTAVTVTADNFVLAETDVTFASFVKQGALGKLEHFRELAPIEDQHVKRGNRDTIYSMGILDLDAGPATITLPDAGTRYMTMMVVDEDHYVFTVVYGAGRHTLTRKQVGTRYALVAIRILVDPNDPKDLERVHVLQDSIKVEHPGGPGRFTAPEWDPVSHKKVRDALAALGETLPDWRRAAGRKGEVDEVRHLIVTATGWGLNPDRDAIHLNVTPERNDGMTIYMLSVKDVPVDGFWSISVYNAEGYYVKNTLNAYTLNNITAKKAPDGSVVIQFGGCDGKAENCLPIVKGWNYIVRLYRPRAEILEGRWSFPEAKPAVASVPE